MGGKCRLGRLIVGMRQEPAPDELVGRIAARQHGVVTLDQLRASGVTSSGISRRIAAGRLHRIHRGVYAVGHAGLSLEGRWMAAVKACGPGALLSHRSAGALWRITSRSGGHIDVSVPGRGGRERRAGIRIHRPALLLPSQATLRHGIPVTKPARTLEDLRRVLPDDQFAAAVREAEYLRLPIGDRFETDRTRSELEARFLVLCRRHRVPAPEVNVRVGPFLVDFLWPRQRLIVEVDGWDSHRTRSAFEADRARDPDLTERGYTVLRFTWRQLAEDAATVVRTIRTLLENAPPPNL
jgi:very-short-patch-repair endonuclease